MERLARFKRATLTFGGLRSIQLSYRRVLVQPAGLEPVRVSSLESESSASTSSAMAAIYQTGNSIAK